MVMDKQDVQTQNPSRELGNEFPVHQIPTTDPNAALLFCQDLAKFLRRLKSAGVQKNGPEPQRLEGEKTLQI